MVFPETEYYKLSLHFLFGIIRTEDLLAVPSRSHVNFNIPVVNDVTMVTDIQNSKEGVCVYVYVCVHVHTCV